MAELTDRIRDWLQGTPRPHALSDRQQAARDQLQGHIDENLLKSFIGRERTVQEHEAVLEHLNRCKDCREAIAVVLLSQDDPAAAAEIALESKKRAEVGSLWWRTALRWTGIVFVTFVVGSMIYVLPMMSRTGFSFSSIFKSGEPSSPRTPSSESNTTFSEWINSTYSSQDEDKRAAQKAHRARDKSQQVSPGWDTGPAPHHDRVEAMPGAMEVEIPRSNAAESEEKKATSAAPRGTAAPVPPTNVSQSHAAGAHASTGRRLVVTDEGELLRTLDGGATWKIITIKRGLAFRSLAVAGGKIWAAGEKGALYRSPDAAEHWQQVILKYRDAPLTDAIDDIRFADAQHGQLMTADGDSWISVDGGNTWILSVRHRSAQ